MTTTSDQTSSFETWNSQFLANKIEYGNSIWENIGKHPQDILFLDLGEIYITASSELRMKIKGLFEKRPEQTWQLVLFIRRIAKMINFDTQTKLVKIGLAIADIVMENEDYRDISISVAILKYGSEKVGINVTELIENEISNYSAELSTLLNNLMKWSKNDMKLSLLWFGPPEWR
ncbi:MAG: hypothetical protein HY867_00540 [Chloroflexi bacterium]|nr:hypothetical protein [Chloroflexota bacterium]